MELSFAKAHAKTNDATFAAWKAGYSKPHELGSQLKRKPEVMSASREETIRYLYEEAGAIGAKRLGEICVDPNAPYGAQVKAAEILCKLANIAVKDDLSTMADSEMSAQQLDEMRRKVSAQGKAFAMMLAKLPAFAIEAHSVFD